MIAGGGDDLARHLEAALGLHRDLVVVRERDHRGAVTCDDRQDRLEPLVLAGDGVDERLALVRAEPGFERLDHRRVDAERQIGQALDERDRRAHQLDLVGERIADVDVEHVGAAGNLLRDVQLDAGQVAVLQLCLKLLAARRVDALADHAERALGADDDGLGRRLENGLHSVPFLGGLACEGDGRPAHQTGTAARRCSIRSLARRTAVDASAA